MFVVMLVWSVIAEEGGGCRHLWRGPPSVQGERCLGEEGRIRATQAEASACRMRAVSTHEPCRRRAAWARATCMYAMQCLLRA